MENLKTKFDFDDILIIPNTNTHIYSRYRGIVLPNELPLFTAPMDTVVDLSNFEIFLENNINVCLPRTIKYDDYVKHVSIKNINRRFNFLTDDINSYNNNIFISVGFTDLDLYYKKNFKIFHENAHILIDVANGHMQKIIDYCKEIKRLRPDIIIMVGNIANPETYRWYAENQCVDYIRVGIGNGSGCLTTKQSGVGYPMASLLHEVYLQKQIQYEKNYNISNTGIKIKRSDAIKLPAIVADGGMKDYSDIIKALALGADYVMLGSIFNKALESCADNYLFGIKLNNSLAKYFFDNGFPIKKYYRGMSTKDAQKAMGKTNFKTSEGITRFRKVEYSLYGWIENFRHYLRTAMSYVDAKTLNDFIGNVKIILITKNAYDRYNK